MEVSDHFKHFRRHYCYSSSYPALNIAFKSPPQMTFVKGESRRDGMELILNLLFNVYNPNIATVGGTWKCAWILICQTQEKPHAYVQNMNPVLICMQVFSLSFCEFRACIIVQWWPSQQACIPLLFGRWLWNLSVPWQKPGSWINSRSFPRDCRIILLFLLQASQI